MPRLKTLQTNDQERIEQYVKNNEKHVRKNGISCPRCHSELYDIGFDHMEYASVVRQDIVCPTCGWTGERLI